jgi:hypothetical protein
VARIETLCEPLGRKVLVSAALAAAVPDGKRLDRLVPMSSRKPRSKNLLLK